MKSNDIPSDIGNYLEYDETSSTFLRWKKQTHISNRINVGDEAGSLNKSTSYYHTFFNNKAYLTHRIVFFLHNGYCPEVLDHVDCVRTNNNINNIRESTLSENSHNRKINKNSTTGVKGLSISKNKYWQLQIKKNGKVAFIETYKLTEKTKEECRIILENKRKELHGNFSNNG